LPQGNSIALVLAWTDEDLDHCVLSARLAEVMADRLDDPVLLIDLGPKRRLSTLLQAPALGSLTDAMVGFVSWRDQIVQTSTAGLCLLPSGPNDFEADPVAVARLIEACKEDFGIVLVVGGVLSVIPENVLTACDAAVLLVEAGHTSAAKAAGAIERLRRSGTDVAGCLLTGAAEGK
jgi:cellulose biosynthesis protein BcsQ